MSAVLTLFRIPLDATDFFSVLTRSDGLVRLKSGSHLDLDD